MTQKLPQTTVVEDHETSATTPSTTTHANTNATHDRARTSTSSEARAAALANEAEAMQMSLLAAFGGTSAVENALKRNEVPIGDLGKVDRVDPHDHELRLTTGMMPGPTVPGLRQLGDGQTHEGTTHERTVEGPKFDMNVIGDPATPIPAGLEGAIARLRPSFRSCYVRKGLDVDPTMEGKLVIDLAIAPNGDVTTVTKFDGAGLSSAVEQCIIERAHNASFPASGGTGTHARVPIIFRQQH
jgi:hypothetical protein